NPGGSVTLTASGLQEDLPAEVYLGTRLVGGGATDDTGNLSTVLHVPSNFPQGLTAVVIRAGGRATSPACPLQGLGRALTAATSAVVEPPPTVSGWWNRNVRIGLHAEDALGGAGIRDVTFGAEGAEHIDETVTHGPDASAVIAAQGATTFT